VGEREAGRPKLTLAGLPSKLEPTFVEHPKAARADRMAEAFGPAVDLAGKRSVAVEAPVEHVALFPASTTSLSRPHAKKVKLEAAFICTIDENVGRY
jgi:hypothetical protein